MLNLKSLTTTVLLLLSCLAIHAQEFKLSGKLFDQDKNAIAYCNVLLSEDDKVIRAVYSDESGSFVMQAPTGNFILAYYLFDQLLHEEEIEITEDKNLGEIELQPLISLEDIQIKSRRKLIERKSDRLIYNAKNAIAGRGGTALDLLKSTPGVLVQYNSISIMGKSGVRIMIDNVEKSLMGEELFHFLKNLSANDIKSIEVITNPSSKYTAEGNSGILHLILEENKENHWSNTVNSSYTQSKYALIDINNNFSFKKDKLSIGVKMGYTNGALNANVNKDIFYPQQQLSDRGVIKSQLRYLSPQIGIDYEINDKIKMGIQYDFFGVKTDKMSHNDVRYINAMQGTDSLYRSKIWLEDDNDYHTLNYYSLIKIDSSSGKQLRFDFNIFNNEIAYQSTHEAKSYLPTGDVLDFSQNSLDEDMARKNSDYSLKLDMEHPTAWIDLNYGTNISFLTIENKINYFDKQQAQDVFSNNFNYSENKQAFYISGQKSIGKSWEAQVGLRAENTQIKTISEYSNEKHTRNHIAFFPTAYISYTPKDKHHINVNYGRRINRPHFMYLNPFKTQNSIYEYTEGNPMLKPSYSNNLEFNYLYNQSLNFQLFYNRINRGFDFLNQIDENKMQLISRPENYLKSNAYGLGISYNKSVLPWWETYASANFQYSKANSYLSELLQELKGQSWYVNFYNNFHFNEHISFNVNYYYFSPGTQGLDKNKERHFIDAHLLFNFLDNDLEISLAYTDVFQSNRYRSTSYYNSIKIYSDIFIENSFRLSLSYKFGNKSIRSREFSENENIFRM